MKDGIQVAGVLFSGGIAGGMNATFEELTNLLYFENIKLIAFRKGWLGLMNADCFIPTPKTVLNFSKIGGGHIGSCTKVNVFKYKKKPVKKYARAIDYSGDCLKTYIDLELDCLFVLGGDGSMRQSEELIRTYPEMKIIHIPCTMDMDVLGTEQTIGAHTAVHFATQAIIENTIDANDMGRICISEAMGRSSGYVAANATLAALEKVRIDVLLLPELGYSYPNLVEFITTHKIPLSIVIAEGVGEESLQNMTGDHKQLAGKSIKLAKKLTKSTLMSFKANPCGYGQRSGIPSEADILLAKLFVNKAVESFVNDEMNVSICFTQNTFHTTDLISIAKLNSSNKVKGLSQDAQVIKRLQHLGIYFEYGKNY